MAREPRKSLGTLLLSGFAVGMIGLLGAMVLHREVNATYNPWSNYISDMSVGPQGSNVVFIVMMILIALLTGLLFSISARSLKSEFRASRTVDVARVCGLIGALDVFVMVFFPLDPARCSIFTAHVVTAVIVFVCMTGYLGSYSVVFRSATGLGRLASYVAAIGAVLTGTFAGLLALTELASVISRHTVTYLLQWGAFGFFSVWALLAGIHLRRTSSVRAA